MQAVSFIVLQTKILNNVIMVYGGLVFHRASYENCMADFKWFKLSEVKHEL